MSYKFDELELLARQAGFDPKISPTIAAISLAESGGNPKAHNPTYPDNSYGLMQVNMLDEPGYQLGAERRNRYGLQSNEELFDPLTNMRAAKDIYDSQGLEAWSVYSSGAYKKHLPSSFTPLKKQSYEAMPSEMKAVRMAGSNRGGGGILGTAINNVREVFERGEESPQPRRMAAATATGSSDMPLKSGELVALGRELEAMGFKVAEHPQFGGVGQHSPNSHHYAGHAFDLTIQPGSRLLAGRPDSDWRQLTSDYGEKLRGMFPGAEIFYPGYDAVGGHDSHIHLAFPGGVIRRS